MFTRFRMLAAFAALAGVRAQWVKGVTDAMARGADAATVEQLVAEGGGITTEVCGGVGDAFDVSKISAQANGMALVVDGTLKRPIRGGEVRAKLRLLKPKGMSVASHFKYAAATAFTRTRKFTQPLCEHLGLSGADGGCSLEPGSQQMRFSFGRMPSVLFVGRYTLQVEVVDEAGGPITCARGSLAVQPGPSKGVLRKLESGCPAVIYDHLNLINRFWTDENCDENGKDRTTWFETTEGFYMIGRWWDQCGSESRLTLYSNYPRYMEVINTECASNEECPQDCGTASCEYGKCNVEGHEGWRCEAAESWEYETTPDKLDELCTGDHAVAFASPCSAATLPLAAAAAAAGFFVSLAPGGL